MKKKNQEALRTALNEFQDAYRVCLDDEMKMQEAEERGIRGQVSPTSPYSYQEWQIKWTYSRGLSSRSFKTKDRC